MGFPDGAADKESTCNSGDTGDVGLIPGQMDPLEMEMATHSSILALKESHGQRSLLSDNPWGRKKSDTTEPTRTHSHVVR